MRAKVANLEMIEKEQQRIIDAQDKQNPQLGARGRCAFALCVAGVWVKADEWTTHVAGDRHCRKIWRHSACVSLSRRRSSSISMI